MGKSLLGLRGKKRKPRTAKSFDEKYMGSEPEWTDEVPTGSEIRRAYNWYNYFYSTKEKAKLLFDNYPRDKKEIRLLKKLPDWKMNSTCCYQARMMALGCKLPAENLDYFNECIEELLNEAKQIQDEKKETKPTAEKPSVQDRIKEQISDYIGEIEEEIDRFTLNKYKSDFDMYKWLRQNNVKQQQSNAIANHYKALLSELELLVSGNAYDVEGDKQLEEGYSHMKKSEKKRFLDFVNGIVSDAAANAQTQKTTRKTRVKKPASVEKQTSRMQFMPENVEYKIASINPSSIIGSNQLWVFNVKYKNLRVYNAMGPAGFSVKGTTLQGFDPDNSYAKALRKPHDVLPQVLNGGKRVLNNLMGNLTTKATEPNGRINKDCILLRVIK